jgi:hypothetical protein
MPDEKAPSSGASLRASLMHFCSGKPMHFCSGVDMVVLEPARKLTFSVTTGVNACKLGKVNVCGVMTWPPTVNWVVTPWACV